MRSIAIAVLVAVMLPLAACKNMNAPSTQQSSLPKSGCDTCGGGGGM